MFLKCPNVIKNGKKNKHLNTDLNINNLMFYSTKLENKEQKHGE